jgi:hypothetical protein
MTHAGAVRANTPRRFGSIAAACALQQVFSLLLIQFNTFP